MNLVVVFGIVTALSFLVAAVAALAVRSGYAIAFTAHHKAVLALAMLLYAFVGVSNALEHSGITDALDIYEDYAEILFIPLVAHVVYSLLVSRQLESATRTERMIRGEHELLTSIVETTPTGILVADDAGAIVLANEAARRMLHLEPAPSGSDLLVCPVCTGRRGESVLAGAPLDLGAIVASAPLEDVLQTFRHGGSERFLSASATPFAAAGGERSVAVVVVDDVSDRIRAEREVDEYRSSLERMVDARTAQLLEANRLLADANLAKQDFLASMSHELRTPLNSIIGFTDLLLAGYAGPLEEEQRKQLGMVKQSSGQLLALVDEVLDLSRIEAGRAEIEPSDLDTAAFLELLAASMQPLARARGIDLSWECRSCEVVNTDADKLGQILRNLVSNAIKFTDPGGRVQVVAEGAEDGARFVVEDNGVGIALADQARIFEPFQQAHSDDRPRPAGTGLGLAICQRLAVMLGGTVELESEPGRGSTFTLVLPHPRAAEPSA